MVLTSGHYFSGSCRYLWAMIARMKNLVCCVTCNFRDLWKAFQPTELWNLNKCMASSMHFLKSLTTLITGRVATYVECRQNGQGLDWLILWFDWPVLKINLPRIQVIRIDLDFKKFGFLLILLQVRNYGLSCSRGSHLKLVCNIWIG